MSFSTLTGVLASAVSTSGTFTTGYPTGTRIGDFSMGPNHYLVVGGKKYSAPTDFTVAFTNSTTITITWLGTNTLPAGAAFTLQLDKWGVDPVYTPANVAVNRAFKAQSVVINLGAPVVAAVAGVAAVQLKGAAGDLTLASTTVTLDVPRNITLTVATTNQSGVTFTIYGTDEYGATMVESITGPNNNTVAGVKAFKTVTRVACSAAIATNGVSVGYGDVLGLPFRVSNIDQLVEFQDGLKPTAGTFVAGLSPLTKSTATTADVRGTYDPNAACDGAKVFQLIATVGEVSLGNPQYAG